MRKHYNIKKMTILYCVVVVVLDSVCVAVVVVLTAAVAVVQVVGGGERRRRRRKRKQKLPTLHNYCQISFRASVRTSHLVHLQKLAVVFVLILFSF